MDVRSVCSFSSRKVSESMSTDLSTSLRKRRADRTFSTMKCLMEHTTSWL